MPYTLLAETSGVATFGRERRHRDVVVVVIDVIDWMLNIILIFRPLAKLLVYWLNFITRHCNLKLNYDLRKRSLKSLPLPVGSRVENTAALCWVSHYGHLCFIRIAYLALQVIKRKTMTVLKAKAGSG